MTFAGFDGLRAIAALAVLVTHASFTAGANVNHWAGAYFARLDVGVSIFFCISGFLLYRPYVLSARRGSEPLRFLAFMRRRVLRIFPAYWLALTVVVFVLGQATIESFGEAVAYYGLLQIYDSDLINGGIGQAWSLCTEISFYLFIPAYAAILRRGRGRLGPEVTGLAALAAIAFVWKLVVLESGGSAHLLTWLPAYLDLFALGMLLAVVSVWTAHRAFDVFEAVLGRAWVSWSLAALSFFVVSTQIGLPRGFEEVSVAQAFGRHLLYGVTGFFLIAPAVFGTSRRGGIRWVLESRPMVVLGLISYGIYLWHKAVIAEVRKHFDMPMFDSDLSQLLGWTLVVTMAVAAVSYVVVERPALRFKTDTRAPIRGLGVVDALVLVALAVIALVLGPLASNAYSSSHAPAPVAPAQPAPAVEAPAPAPPPENAPRRTVLLLGDSVMFDAAPAVEAAFGSAGDYVVASHPLPGTGLARDSGFDWRSAWRGLVAETAPSAVVLHLGAWDATPQVLDGRTVSPRDPAWTKTYVHLLAEAESILAERGAHLYLLGSPEMAEPERAADLAAYNRLLSAYAAGRPGVTFIETRSALPLQPQASGAGEALRKPDGIHLCPGGAARMAEAVVGAVAGGGVARSHDWQTGAWRDDARYSGGAQGCAE